MRVRMVSNKSRIKGETNPSMIINIHVLLRLLDTFAGFRRDGLCGDNGGPKSERTCHMNTRHMSTRHMSTRHMRSLKLNAQIHLPVRSTYHKDSQHTAQYILLYNIQHISLI